jgi:hypothetical protein
MEALADNIVTLEHREIWKEEKPFLTPMAVLVSLSRYS